MCEVRVAKRAKRRGKDREREVIVAHSTVRIDHIPDSEMTESRRRKIAELGTERDLQGYSLPNLLKELAFLTYELKSMRTMLLLEKEGDEGAGGDGDEGLMDTVNGLDREWLEEREQSLGNCEYDDQRSKGDTERHRRESKISDQKMPRNLPFN